MYEDRNVVKEYDIEKENIKVIDSGYTDQYDAMLKLELLGQKNLMINIKSNFKDKTLLNLLRKELTLSKELVVLLSKLIKGVNSDTLDAKKYNKLLNKIEKNMEKRQQQKEKRETKN